MAEIEGKEEEEDAKRSKEFETNNPDFCTQMIDDMKTRSEARWVLRQGGRTTLAFATSAAGLNFNRFCDTIPTTVTKSLR